MPSWLLRTLRHPFIERCSCRTRRFRASSSTYDILVFQLRVFVLRHEGHRRRAGRRCVAVGWSFQAGTYAWMLRAPTWEIPKRARVEQFGHARPAPAQHVEMLHHGHLFLQIVGCKRCRAALLRARCALCNHFLIGPTLRRDGYLSLQLNWSPELPSNASAAQ